MMVWDVAILVEFIMTWNWFKDDTLVLWCLYDFKIRNFQTSPSNPFSFPLSLQNHPASFLNRHPPSSEDTVVDTFGEHNKNQQNQALIDVDPTTFETLELPHEQQAGPEMLPCDPPCWLMIFIWGNILTYTLGIVIFHQRNPYSSQFMTPPSQQRIEGKWVSVCQLWAMMTQEERESSCQKEVWSRWRQNLSAFKGASITSYHIETRRFWICLNNSQYLAKQQDQVWMVQAPRFPGPKEDKSQMHSNARWAFASSTITTRAMAQSQRCLGKDWDVRWHRSKCP